MYLFTLKFQDKIIRILILLQNCSIFSRMDRIQVQSICFLISWKTKKCGYHCSEHLNIPTQIFAILSWSKLRVAKYWASLHMRGCHYWWSWDSRYSHWKSRTGKTLPGIQHGLLAPISHGNGSIIFWMIFMPEFVWNNALRNPTRSVYSVSITNLPILEFV